MARRLLLAALLTIAVAGTARAQDAAASPPPILWLAPPPDAVPPQPAPSIVALFIPPPPDPKAVALPPSARALLEQAIDQGTPDSFAAIAKLARERYPQGGAQIDALAAENDAKTAERKAVEARRRADALAAASFLDNWKGEVDLGGSYTRGVTDAVAVYGAFKLDKEGLNWRHAITARADYAKSAGELSTDKDTAAYQPQYKLTDRLYAFGLGQFDRDEILGFSHRFTESLGPGYVLVTGDRLKIDVQAGPGLRETRYVGSDRFSRTAIGGRAAVSFTWKPNDIIQLTDTTSFFFLTDNTNLTSTTALDTRLFGPLKVRLSYNLTYEQDTPTVARSFDTITTASIVFSF